MIIKIRNCQMILLFLTKYLVKLIKHNLSILKYFGKLFRFRGSHFTTVSHGYFNWIFPVCQTKSVSTLVKSKFFQLRPEYLYFQAAGIRQGWLGSIQYL